MNKSLRLVASFLILLVSVSAIPTVPPVDHAHAHAVGAAAAHAEAHVVHVHDSRDTEQVFKRQVRDADYGADSGPSGNPQPGPAAPPPPPPPPPSPQTANAPQATAAPDQGEKSTSESDKKRELIPGGAHGVDYEAST